MLTEYFQNCGLSCDIYQQLYQQHIPGTESSTEQGVHLGIEGLLGGNINM